MSNQPYNPSARAGLTSNARDGPPVEGGHSAADREGDERRLRSDGMGTMQQAYTN
jgi:hypothetical protein